MPSSYKTQLVRWQKSSKHQSALIFVELQMIWMVSCRRFPTAFPLTTYSMVSGFWHACLQTLGIKEDDLFFGQNPHSMAGRAGLSFSMVKLPHAIWSVNLSCQHMQHCTIVTVTVATSQPFKQWQSEFIYILVDGQVRTGGKVQNDDILAFAKLFNDELTLDNISRCTCAPPSVLGQGVLRAIRSHHNCSFPTLGGSINLSQF